MRLRAGGNEEPAITVRQPDIELADRAAAGDQRAWAAIHSAYHTPVYRYVAARVPDHEAADIAAEVFVAAVNSIQSYARERPLLAWLYGIARHRVADYHRRSRRREPFIARLPGFGRFRQNVEDQGEAFTPADPSPQSDPVTSIEGLDIKQALRKLTEDQREVVTLRYFMGLTTAEIAALLGRRPAAIYSLEARALLKLRQELS